MWCELSINTKGKYTSYPQRQKQSENRNDPLELKFLTLILFVCSCNATNGTRQRTLLSSWTPHCYIRYFKDRCRTGVFAHTCLISTGMIKHRHGGHKFIIIIFSSPCLLVFCDEFPMIYYWRFPRQ